MDTMYELTEAECELVAAGGQGKNVAFFNHNTGTGPGHVLQTGPLVRLEVHAVQDGATAFGPGFPALWAVPFAP